MSSLLRLQHCLRILPPPVTARRLAAEMECSERTIYRQIDKLRTQGAVIDGEAGYGYTMREDPSLPPQSLSQLEVEALGLAMAQIAAEADMALAEAAKSAFAKIIATLPAAARHDASHLVHYAHRFHPRETGTIDPQILRDAARCERVVTITYRDAKDAITTRKLWPLMIVWFENAMILAAWCHLRQDFRSFRLDRLISISPTGESFRPRRVALCREFLAKQRRNDCM